MCINSLFVKHIPHHPPPTTVLGHPLVKCTHVQGVLFLSACSRPLPDLCVLCPSEDLPWQFLLSQLLCASNLLLLHLFSSLLTLGFVSGTVSFYYLPSRTSFPSISLSLSARLHFSWGPSPFMLSEHRSDRLGPRPRLSLCGTSCPFHLILSPLRQQNLFCPHLLLSSS